MKYNFHTHTIRCGHASGTDEEYVISAIDNRFKILGFSDHCPYYKLSFPIQRMEWKEYKKYLKSIDKLKKKYQKKIKIYAGFECEYFSNHLEQLKELKKHCDYLILGQHHYLKDNDCYNYSSLEELDLLLKDIHNAFESGLFLYFAHPDYYLLNRPIWDDIAINLAHEICKLSLKYDMPLEINAKGFRLNRYHKNIVYYPYPKFWKIVANYGCKVCIGFDAHTPNDLSDNIIEIKKYVFQYKLNLITTEEILKRIES